MIALVRTPRVSACVTGQPLGVVTPPGASAAEKLEPVIENAPSKRATTRLASASGHASATPAYIVRVSVSRPGSFGDAGEEVVPSAVRVASRNWMRPDSVPSGGSISPRAGRVHEAARAHMNHAAREFRIRCSAASHMPLRVMLMAALVAACNEGTPPAKPAPPAPPVTGSGSGSAPGSAMIATTPIDAAVPVADAMVFAVFDHLPVRQAKKMSPPPTVADDADTIARPRLAVKPLERTADRDDIPPWCQRVLNRQPVQLFHPLADGRSLVATVNEVALIGADHHPLLGIELSTVVNPFFGPDVGFPTTMNLSDARAQGNVVVAALIAQNENGDALSLLVAVDTDTGGIVWQTSPGAVQQRFVTLHGYAMTSANHRISAVRLRAGNFVTSVAPPEQAYNLDRTADGLVIASALDATSALEVTLR